MVVIVAGFWQCGGSFDAGIVVRSSLRRSGVYSCSDLRGLVYSSYEVGVFGNVSGLPRERDAVFGSKGG